MWNGFIFAVIKCVRSRSYLKNNGIDTDGLQRIQELKHLLVLCLSVTDRLFGRPVDIGYRRDPCTTKTDLCFQGTKEHCTKYKDCYVANGFHLSLLATACSWKWRMAFRILLLNPKSPRALSLSSTNHDGICNKGQAPGERIHSLKPLPGKHFTFTNFQSNMWWWKHVAWALEMVHMREGTLKRQFCVLHNEYILLWWQARQELNEPTI